MPFSVSLTVSCLICLGPLLLSIGVRVEASTGDAPTRTGETSFVIGEEIVVTGRRMADPHRLLTSIDRMSAETAQAANVDYVWELAGQMPGVVMTEFNQGTTSGKLSFRGFNGEGEVNAVKLLIDGIPSNSNDGNMPYIDMLFPLELEAVELVRGTNDPRFGLHNIAGNINYLTRSGGNQVEGKLATGSFGQVEGQMVAGIEGERLQQNYTVGYRTSDGYRDHSDLDRSGMAGKWGFALNDQMQLGATARYYESDAEEPGYLTQADANDDPEGTNAYNASDKDHREMTQFSLSLDTALSDVTDVHALVWRNHLEDDRFVKFSAAASQQNRYTEETHHGALATLNYAPRVESLHSVALELGASIEQQDNVSRRYLTVEREITSQTRDQKFDLTVTGVYGQIVVEPVRWLRLTPGWRIDRVDGDFTNRLNGTDADVNDYGTISQPKIALAVLASDQFTLFANWGRSFQIGVGSGAYLIPPRDTDLEPSINDGWEAGARYVSDAGFESRLAFWNQTATGEIKRKLNDPLGDSDNLGATERQGVDLQVSWSAGDAFSLWAALAWQEASIDKPDPATPDLDGNRIDHVPEWIFTTGLDVAVTPQLTLSALLRNQTAYELTTTNDHGTFGDFTLLDISATYAVTPRIDLGLQVKNLTDHYYEYVWWDGQQSLHSPGEGRAVIGSVRMRF